MDSLIGAGGEGVVDAIAKALDGATLKALCKARGLPVSGTKKALAERLAGKPAAPKAGKTEAAKAAAPAAVKKPAASVAAPKVQQPAVAPAAKPVAPPAPADDDFSLDLSSSEA